MSQRAEWFSAKHVAMSIDPDFDCYQDEALGDDQHRLVLENGSEAVVLVGTTDDLRELVVHMAQRLDVLGPGESGF